MNCDGCGPRTCVYVCVYDVVYCAFRDLFVELCTLRVCMLIGINWQWKVLIVKSCAVSCVSCAKCCVYI